MMKKTLTILLLGISSVVFADNTTASAPVKMQKKQYEKNNAVDSNHTNSPNVNSRLYSGALFPQQNSVTGKKGVKYNASRTGSKNKNTGSKYNRNNATEANQANSPNVNSRLYSGAQFPQQNAITGTKGVKYNASQAKRQNSTDNSKYQQNNATEANFANSPNVNSRLYSGAQFPQQNDITGTKLDSSSAK